MSMITNVVQFQTDLEEQPNHEEVLETSRNRGNRMVELIKRVVVRADICGSEMSE